MLAPTHPSLRTLSRVALAAGLVMCVGGASLAGDETVPAEDVLRIASDEPVTVRFATAVRKTRVGSESFRIVRESDGEPVRGRYVAGRFLVDPETGSAVVVDPEAYIQAVQVVEGVDRPTATAFVEAALARVERTGRVRDLDVLREVMHDLAFRFEMTTNGRPYRPSPELNTAESNYYRLLPQQDGPPNEAALALRKLQAGDDDLWERYILDGDAQAFEMLAADPSAMRFHHSVEPATGRPHADSDFRRRENRRYLFAGGRTGRVFTFVPDIPQTVQLTDLSLTPNELYRVTLSRDLPAPLDGLTAASGFRAALRRRVALLETTYPDHEPSVLAAYGDPVEKAVFRLSELLPRLRLALVESTPPNGERLVDPSTDWENPSNRFTTPQGLRNPFVIRLRFNQPLDPRRVSPLEFTLRLHSSFVGTPNEHPSNVSVPIDVRLSQTRLGDVEVSMTPKIPLDPSATYDVEVRSTTSNLAGRFTMFSLSSWFTTAPLTSEREVVFDDFPAEFRGRLVNWREADRPMPRPVWSADETHDPEAVGLVVPFSDGDDVPISAIESVWFDSKSVFPRYVVNFDDPATPEIEGTNLHVPPGSTVRLFARTTHGSLDVDQPNLLLLRPWTEIDRDHPDFVGGRFLQLRIEFTMPEGTTPDTPDLPFVERVSVVARFP